jgi:CDP-glucose 4,6-dehydratase
MEGAAMKNFWKNRNVFITGCTGLLGSHLTQLLYEQQANVVGLVRDMVPKSDLVQTGAYDKINIVRGCVEDFFTVERALNEYEIDTVFHLAAQTIVGTANRNPLSTFESNIKGTWCLLEACRRVPIIKRIVIASSDKAYGEQEELPYEETAPLKGSHPYDVSKSCADLIASAYHRTYKLPVCVTRCGNFYGPGDLNFNRIVPGTIRSVLNNEPPKIRSDGTYIRDYFYVKDAALAYLHLAEKMEDAGIHGEVFNFSNELQIPVLELVNKILKLMGRTDLKPVILNQAEHEIKHQYLSARKARELLGWQPKYDLDAALKETVAWYTKFLQG